MTHSLRTMSKSLLTAILGGVLFSLPMLASADMQGEPKGGVRAMAVEIEAVVTHVDLEHRQVSLQGPMGHVVTLRASEEVVNLEQVNIGDVLLATYMAAIEGEVREPSAEELANPWLELDEVAASDDPDMPSVGGARLIRAVCTIEGMNRLLGTVTVQDSRGMVHIIDHVEPEKMQGVTLGQTIVMVYREALALSLELKPEPAE